MRTRLTFLLALCGWSVFAQINPTPYMKAVINQTNSAAGLRAAAGITDLGTSNTSAFLALITNISDGNVVLRPFTYIAPDTNSVTVAGCNVAAVNGVYTFKFRGVDPGPSGPGGFDDNGPVAVYTNSGGYQFVQLVAGRNPAAYICDPATNTTMYSAFTYNNFGWSQWAKFVGGTAPTLVKWTTLTTNQTTAYRQPASTNDYIGPRVLLNYPTIGLSQMENRNVSLADIPGGVSPKYSLFYQTGGVSGIIRSIKYTAGLNINWSSRSNWVLKIFTDFGTFADINNPGVSPTVEIPIWTLLGSRYRTNATGFAAVRSTRYFDLCETSTNEAWLICMKLPTLFSNGVLVTMWNRTTDVPLQVGYSDVTYELGPVNRAFSEWRLRGNLTSATYGNDTVIPWLTTTKPGFLVALFHSIAGNPPSVMSDTWPEGMWRLGEWGTDAEDAFQNPFYYIFRDKIFAYDFGTTTWLLGSSGELAPKVVEGYRFWHNDGPVWFGPVNGLWPVHGGYFADVLSLYYGP